jgi:exopolysaccharide biosynthesis polyprenyl glycosylphosphotransferase
VRSADCDWLGSRICGPACARWAQLAKLMTTPSPAQAEPQVEPPVRLAPAHGLPAPPPGVPSPAATGRYALVEWLFEGRGWTRLLIASDAIMLVLAVVAALVGANAAGVPLTAKGSVIAYPAIVMALLAVRGRYQHRLRTVFLDMVGPVVSATSTGAMVLVAVHALFTHDQGAAPLMARAWFFATIYVVGARALLARAQTRARADQVTGKPTLIVGAGMVGAQIARRLSEQPEYGLRPVGYLDSDPPPRSRALDRRAPVLGGPADLATVAREARARHVILAFSSMPDAGLLPLARQCAELGLEVSIVPRLFESMNDRIELEHLGGLPLFGLRTVDPKGWQFTLKHVMDRGVAAALLLGLSPVMALVAVAVKLTSPGPLLFRQHRVGRDGRAFELLKFRSMRMPDDEGGGFRPEPGSAPGGVEGVDRRTPIGRFIRRTSLDELPQLVNVLRGDMSVVGPRPERPEFVELFRQDVYRYSDRHRVKSGITGWAQVHGLRGQTSLADRVEWDNFYIENWSLWLDLKILLLTFGVIFRPDEE